VLQRFTGEGGLRLTIEVLLEQKLVRGNLPLAELLAQNIELNEIPAAHRLIEQGAVDNSIYLIFAGAFDIVVHGKTVARRFVSDHVGEMAVIDHTQPRSASVVSTEPSLVAKISEHAFSEVAKRFPEVYRNIARELSKRLVQRNSFVAKAHDTIRVFIISSAESLEVARLVQNAFAYDGFIVTVWTDGVFKVASYPLQTLEAAVDNSDFAIAIAHADDIAEFRGSSWPVPRDNVIFELGLFMGRLGKDRAVLMEPREIDVKLPSDLTGITTIPYQYKAGSDAAALMAPSCNALREHIKRLGPNN